MFALQTRQSGLAVVAVPEQEQEQEQEQETGIK